VVLLAVSCGGGESAFPRPVPTVDVVAREYGFQYEDRFRSGRTVVRVRNEGQLQHQLVLIYLPPEIPSLDAQLRSSERQVVPTIVSLQPRAPGRTGTFAIDLDPGRYGFVCFVQDPDGVQHVHKGMSSEFRVA
jgi:hypothetical protein